MYKTKIVLATLFWNSEDCVEMFENISSRMEVQGALEDFRQSEDSLNIGMCNILVMVTARGSKRYKKTSPVGKGVEIEKLECIGHAVNKRMGARLGKLKGIQKESSGVDGHKPGFNMEHALYAIDVRRVKEGEKVCKPNQKSIGLQIGTRKEDEKRKKRKGKMITIQDALKLQQEFNQTHHDESVAVPNNCPGIPLPPQPDLTRWKTWLDAVNYYTEYYGKIMEVIDALDITDNSAVAAVKSLPSEQLLEDILFIDSNFKIESKSIILLESSKLQLSEALNIVYKRRLSKRGCGAAAPPDICGYCLVLCCEIHLLYSLYLVARIKKNSLSMKCTQSLVKSLLPWCCQSETRDKDYRVKPLPPSGAASLVSDALRVSFTPCQPLAMSPEFPGAAKFAAVFLPPLAPIHYTTLPFIAPSLTAASAASFLEFQHGKESTLLQSQSQSLGVWGIAAVFLPQGHNLNGKTAENEWHLKCRSRLDICPEADVDDSVVGGSLNVLALFSPSPEKNNKKKKTEIERTGGHMTNIAMELDPEKVTVKVSPPKFISITLDGTENTMKNISAFYVRRALDGFVGKVKNATRLRKGSLLIGTISPKQSERLLKAKLLGSNPIKVEWHSSLNTTRGVVHTDSLGGMSDEEIQLDLAEHPCPRLTVYYMPKVKNTRASLLKTLEEVGKEYFTVEEGNITCKVCDVTVKGNRARCIRRHCNRRKLRGAREEVLQFGGAVRYRPMNDTTLRTSYVDNCYEDTLNIIRRNRVNKKIWVSVDETTAACGRHVGHVVIGTLSPEGTGKSYLLTSEVLEKTIWIQQQATDLGRSHPNQSDTQKLRLLYQRIPNLTGPVASMTSRCNEMNKTAGRIDAVMATVRTKAEHAAMTQQGHNSHDVIRLLIPALYKNQSDSLMTADGACHHLCKLMAPVRHRWSINDVIGGIRNTVMPSIAHRCSRDAIIGKRNETVRNVTTALMDVMKVEHEIDPLAIGRSNITDIVEENTLSQPRFSQELKCDTCKDEEMSLFFGKTCEALLDNIAKDISSKYEVIRKLNQKPLNRKVLKMQ
ncbi:hypothetical protein ANN_27993 [Periplaneta americana]|uniref:Uncharacterized protein n=1 Tax=Periplaneta americana TaxID=6978 RepID=A0ABQ8RUL5_PERAM|nr:hypothetical protein ANN_27993 [Periplaneta americana]